MRERFHRDELAKDFSRRPLEDMASLIADA
jgi:hypothetical protein